MLASAAMLDRTELLPRERLPQPPPETFPRALQETLSAKVITLPPTAAITISRAQLNHEALIFHRWPLAISFAQPRDGERFQRMKPRLRFLVKNYLLRAPRRATSVLWCIDNLSPGNWYHWLTEVLPRLHAARSLFSSVEHFGLPAYYSRYPFVEETLRLWPDAPPILWIPRARRVIAEELLFIERAGPPWGYRPALMRELADYMVSQCLPPADEASASPIRIYVTRADAAWRRVANENEIRSLLEGEGFVTVSGTELSVAEQVRMFSRATDIVGPHGAGLANMIFARSGARVLEFATTDPHAHWECYYNLAHSMGHRYGLVCSETTAGPTASFAERRDGDLRVNPENLMEALRATEAREALR